MESQECHYSCVGVAIVIAGLLAMAGLLMTAIANALKLIAPATRTLAATSTSHAIYMALTAIIPTTSAIRTQKISTPK
jgi:hypothetical protein